ncbi:MAG TPA: nucleotide disphospho-sugar-binding domain-containing protein [Candidatus Limnocylindrales bacterium]|nr:nucleotide disphospho-sugar-binding domain-containing protein [Candidatus Limnocylindrales bacterium]
MAEPLTVLFMPESAYGPTNNCIGIGDVLRRRGHTVVFAAEASWRGRLEPLGFVEDLVDLAPPPEADATGTAPDPGQFWKDFIRDTAPEFRKPTIRQLGTFMAPTWAALIDGARYCEPQLREIIARQRPDVIVEDNVVSFPALQTAGRPFVRIVSCNPLEIRGPDPEAARTIPPTYSGLPSDDPTEWEAFREEYDRTHRPMWEDFDAWCRENGTAPLPELEFIHPSTDLNLYVYPQVVDYTERRPLDPALWQRLDSSVRATDAAFELPPVVRERPAGSAVIYLSLGSLGSADVDLMRRLVSVLGETPHRYIVSKGPQHALYDLPPNMWGAEFVPQTSIMPLVDLVITHGGNNTTTEAFHFGKPMIVLPLFWDQYDNAQRVDETGFGARLATYAFEPADLTGAINRLLGDGELRTRLAGIGAEIRARDGVGKAATAIETVGLAGR